MFRHGFRLNIYRQGFAAVFGQLRLSFLNLPALNQLFPVTPSSYAKALQSSIDAGDPMIILFETMRKPFAPASQVDDMRPPGAFAPFPKALPNPDGHLDQWLEHTAVVLLSAREWKCRQGWRVAIEKGRIVRIRLETQPEGVSVWYEVDVPVFLEIVGGRLAPQTAFFQRRTDIRGNLFLGMKLANVLGRFFAMFPYGD